MNHAIQTAREIILKEIKYLSGFYPYDLEKYVDPVMLYSSSMLVFNAPGKKLPQRSLKRVTSLMAGIELLAGGTSLHNFNVEGQVTDKTKSERNYTVGLLFGDVLYSRAVIYILEYGDFTIFDSILKSLKDTHKSRLIMHQKLVEVFGNKKNKLEDLGKTVKKSSASGNNKKRYKKQMERLLEENKVLVSGINSLLKTVFLIGRDIFADKNKDQKLPGGIINDFVLLKSLNDLHDFFEGLFESSQFLESIPWLKQKKQQIIDRINNSVSAGTVPFWFNDNISSLEKIFGKNILIKN